MSDNEKEMVNVQFEISAEDLGRYLTDFQFLGDIYEINGKPLGQEMLRNNKLYQFLRNLYKNTEYWKAEEEMQKRLARIHATKRDKLH